MSDNIKSIISLRRDVKRLKEAVVALGRRGVAGEELEPEPEPATRVDFSITVIPTVHVFLQPNTATATSYQWARRISTYFTLNGLADNRDKSSYSVEFALDASTAPNVNAIVTDDHDGLITIVGLQEFTSPQNVHLTISATRLSDGATASGEITFSCRYRIVSGSPTPATPPAPPPEPRPKQSSQEVVIERPEDRDSWGGQFTLTVNNPYILGGTIWVLRANRSYIWSQELAPLFTASDTPSEIYFSFFSGGTRTAIRRSGFQADLSESGRLTVRDTGAYGWEGTRPLTVYIRARTRFTHYRKRYNSNWADIKIEMKFRTEKPLRPPAQPRELELSPTSTHINSYGVNNRIDVDLNRQVPSNQQQWTTINVTNHWRANTSRNNLSQISYSAFRTWLQPGGLLSINIQQQSGQWRLRVRHATHTNSLPANGYYVVVRVSAVWSQGGTPPLVSEDTIDLIYRFRTSARNWFGGGFSNSNQENRVLTWNGLGYS